MKKLMSVVTVLVVTLGVSSAQAKNVWRDCGIGALIFPTVSWAAIISNIIWDLGTTATSTNMSSDDQCAGKSASTAKFIYQNYANIEEQTAIGSGEHVTAMLNTLGCSSQSQPQIINALRSDLQNNMSNSSYSTKAQNEKAEGYYNSLMNNVQTQFAKECQVI